MDKKEFGSGIGGVSISILSSGLLTMVAFSVTAGLISLLLINARSTFLQLIFTIAAAALFLFMVWMLITAVSMLYDTLSARGHGFNIVIALDLYMLFTIVWINSGFLFWLWDPSEDRDSSFSGMMDTNAFLGWVIFAYITIFIMVGVGFGRYIPQTILAEAWGAALALISTMMMIMVVSSVIAKALDNARSEKSK